MQMNKTIFYHKKKLYKIKETVKNGSWSNTNEKTQKQKTNSSSINSIKMTEIPDKEKQRNNRISNLNNKKIRITINN